MDSAGSLKTVGALKLGSYLDRKRLTLAAFAAKVGTTKALVCRWRDGSRVPGLEYALRIQKQAGIPAAAWLRFPRS